MLVICWVKTHTEIPSVPGAEAEIDQLPRAALDIFRRGAVVEYEQGVGAREKVAGHPQPVLDLVLQAHDHKDVRIAIHENPCMSCS